MPSAEQVHSSRSRGGMWFAGSYNTESSILHLSATVNNVSPFLLCFRFVLCFNIQFGSSAAKSNQTKQKTHAWVSQPLILFGAIHTSNYFVLLLPFRWLLLCVGMVGKWKLEPRCSISFPDSLTIGQLCNFRNWIKSLFWNGGGGACAMKSSDLKSHFKILHDIRASTRACTGHVFVSYFALASPERDVYWKERFCLLFLFRTVVLKATTLRQGKGHSSLKSMIVSVNLLTQWISRSANAAIKSVVSHLNCLFSPALFISTTQSQIVVANRPIALFVYPPPLRKKK